MVGRSLLITSMTFAVLIIILEIVMVSLQFTSVLQEGATGKTGNQGSPETEIPSKVGNLNLAASVSQFIVPSGFTVFQNTKLKIITSGFYLTGLVTNSYLGSNRIALFNLPSDFAPSFATGAIGIITNVLNAAQTHVLLYDKSKSPNTEFLVRSAFTLQPSDRFLVSLFFVN